MGEAVLPPHKPYVFDVMQTFGGYNTLYMALATISGVFLAIAVNYLIGRAIASTKKAITEDIRNEGFGTIEKYAKRWGALVVLLTAWLPSFGVLFVVASGALRIRATHAIGAACISTAAHIIYTLL